MNSTLRITLVALPIVGVLAAVVYGLNGLARTDQPAAKAVTTVVAPAPAATPPPRTVLQRTADLLAAAKATCAHPSESRIRATLTRHFTWEDETIESIACRSVHEGMTGEEVRASWGAPETMNSSSSGQEQWVYGDQYVYLEYGRVTSWQSSR